MLIRLIVGLCLVFPTTRLLAQTDCAHVPTARQQKISNLSRTTETVSAHRAGKRYPGDSPTVRRVDLWTPAQPLNGIDNLTFAKMRADGVPINATCDDATFMRRTSLLLTGRLPEPDAIRTFHASAAPDKRAAYIETVLASDAFHTFWGWYFQEMFESTPFVLRQGLTPYSEFFEAAVAEGKPLDLMARELLTGFGPSNESGPPNFYVRAGEMTRLNQDFWDNAAAHATSKFLGVPTLCISCHDGAYHLEEVNLYLSERTREDLWGMAAFFSGVSRRPIRGENVLIGANVISRQSDGYLAETDGGERPVRDGGLVQPTYFFTGEVPAPGTSWPEAFATFITNDRQFARNFANRLWGHLFGLPMVEPMDGWDLARLEPGAELPYEWDAQVLDRDLLEHATDQLIAFDFDLRAYLRYVTNSATFQMAGTFAPGNWKETYAPYYARFLARHMTAEMVYDTLATATGIKQPIVEGQPGTDAFATLEYAHELNDVNGPRGRRQGDLFQFLQAFGRGNRLDIARTNQGSISQALLLMNSPIVMNRLASGQNRLYQYVEQGLDAQGIVTELYLDLYCREPSNAETASLLAELDAFETTTEKATTAFWLLLNQVAFTFIY